jgi:hypothetical protein
MGVELGCISVSPGNGYGVCWELGKRLPDEGTGALLQVSGKVGACDGDDECVRVYLRTWKSGAGSRLNSEIRTAKHGAHKYQTSVYVEGRGDETDRVTPLMEHHLPGYSPWKWLPIERQAGGGEVAGHGEDGGDRGCGLRRLRVRFRLLTALECGNTQEQHEPKCDG